MGWRAPGRKQQIDLVLRDQLFVDPRGLTRVALIVIQDKLDRPLALATDIQATRRIDGVFPQIVGVQLRWRSIRKDAGFGDGETNAYWFDVLSECATSSA